MENKSKKLLIHQHWLNKYWKKVLLWTAIVLMTLAGFAVYLNVRWKPFLTEQIREAISTSTDSLYSISFKNIDVNILTGTASIKGLRFMPDSLVYREMIKKGVAPKHLFIVEVARLDLNRVHPFKVYFERKLQMNSLLLDRPKVQMIYQKFSPSQDTSIDNRNAYQRLSKYLKSIKVDQISFQNADFQYIDKSAKRNKVTWLKNLDIEIAGLLIDSASQFNRSKLYYTDDIFIRLRDYEFRTPNGMYGLRIKEFSASTRNKFVKLEGFRLIPRYSEMEFAAKLKSRVERYALRFDEILLEQIDFKTFNTDRRLIASKLTISNSNTNIFLNKAMPRQENERVLSFPQNALRQLNLETRVDSVFINNARVSYSEYSPLTKLRGHVFFDQIDGTVSNITNDSISLLKNNISQVNLTGLIMGRGRMDAELKLNLIDKAASFHLNGSVGNMNASLLNKILRPLTLVEIRSGFIEKMEFSFKGNSKGTAGQLSLKYEDLKISILAKDVNNSRLKKMGIASMAANVLIIKSENPSPGESFRIAQVYYSRPDSVSFISMNWKGILGGLKDLIGLDPKTQRKIEVKLKELKIVKAQREQRKEERLKRREERRQNNRR